MLQLQTFIQKTVWTAAQNIHTNLFWQYCRFYILYISSKRHCKSFTKEKENNSNFYNTQVVWITTLTRTLCETATWWDWLISMEPPTMSGYIH
jgi:hypothetical protein